MAFTHGKNTSVWWNSADLSGYLDSAGISIDVDTAETTTFGKNWKTHLAGTIGASIPFTGKYDATAGSAIEGQLATDAGVLTYSPGGGSTIGDRARLASVTSTNYAESAPVGDVVTFQWTAMAETVVGLGYVLHPMGTDTNTTTGAERDDTAATTTGWTAHLHVTAVTGGSWVVKIQDAAVSNTYSDVSGGAFTAATGATSQRLSSASGATLRRYVRYVATRTGGTAGDSITFGLAIARQV